MKNRTKPPISGWAVAKKGLALVVTAQLAFGPVSANAVSNPGLNDGKTATPIKHVIVIIGENRTFDHVFATYDPHTKGQTVANLLYKGIIHDPINERRRSRLWSRVKTGL